ncbi:hypothetical protein DENSPDRAFT_787576, partial [Dentipellis sp. KUC8613]
WIAFILCTALGFDSIVFLIIIITTTKTMRGVRVGHIVRVIYRDGVMYFFVLFTSNLFWVLLVFYARVSSTLLVSSHRFE